MTEKYLKAFLIFHMGEFPKIHQLDHLIELCDSLDRNFNKLKKESIFLSDYYVDARYPTIDLEFSFSEAEEAYRAALKIKRLVIKKIK